VSEDGQPETDLRATLRLPAIRAFVLSRTAGSTSVTLIQAAVAWQVYEISNSALQLGLIGLVRFVPALGMSLIGGAVADSYNRRNIILISQLVPLTVAVVMLAAIAGGRVTLALLYAVVLVTGLASAFEQPARQAILPAIVPPYLFARAVAINSTMQALAFATGPTVAGAAIASLGIAAAYVAYGAFVLLSMTAMVWVPAVRSQSRSGVGWNAIREGLHFVWSRPVLLGAMTLDMFAVIFGGARALLPIYATDILDAGAFGYGLLYAASEVGALLMSILLLMLPSIDRIGRVLVFSVAAYGIATMAFGLSRSFVLSLIAFTAVGMADQVSVIMRTMTIQFLTPDELRGRVSAVNSIFISASNQLGAVESGFVAALTNATFSVVSGGLGCLAVVGIVAARVPALRNYRIGNAMVETSTK
jgi:MFS family permease